MQKPFHEVNNFWYRFIKFFYSHVNGSVGPRFVFTTEINGVYKTIKHKEIYFKAILGSFVAGNM